MIAHPRVADTITVISGGSFVTAHWFVVANTVIQFAAAVVAIVSGLSAAWYYLSQRSKKP